MNKVAGKILVKETGLGVPNLLVVIYDIDPKPLPDDTGNFIDWAWSQVSGDRLGSVITDERGYFEFSYDDRDFQISGAEKRPDLILFVLAPEETRSAAPPSSTPLGQQILHYSNIPRVRAGRIESYVIRLLAAQLDGLGVAYPKPNNLPDPKAVTASLEASFELRNAVRSKLNEQRAGRVAKRKEARRRAEDAFENFNPSSVSPTTRSDATYLAPGDDPVTAWREIAKRDLDIVRETGKHRRFRFNFSTDDIDQLGIPEGPNGDRQVPMKRVLDYIEQKNRGAEFVRTKSSLPPCKERQTANQIISEVTGGEAEGVSGSGSGGAEAGAELDQLTPDAFVREMISRQMGSADGTYSIEARAEQDDVTAAVNALEIKGGPADATAYHDFHNLQIAFEHIWTEEFDKYLEGFGKLIYETFIGFKQDAGVDDSADDAEIETIDELEHWLSGVEFEQQTISEASELPPFLTEFGMTSEQWSSLSLEQKIDSIAFGAAVSGLDADDLREYIESLFEERNNRIAAAAAAEQSADDARFKDIKKLLADLRDRLSESYKFDIFAPDSINYGILVTYRQEWKPLNFQVGELVTTIPLAPKETRRYTKRRIIKKSRSQKEIETSLRIVRRDASDTKRADAEIVDRATNKTNFKAAAEGSGKLGGVVEVSGSVGLETDAAKASSQTKRDFREAVLKSAEEYKQERHIEIETTDVEEVEETTSGEITNPNDELTVTYLLYELQRRYEVRETIHRLTPVILVANRVPKPHDIDHDWLIAHDWILKRVILDDSFLPAMEHVRKLVGAEFSLEVLRSNVQRQAHIVEDLDQQIGLKRQMLGKRLEDVQRALAKQASTTEGESSEGLFESIGEGLFGEGSGEDPEAQRIRAERAKMAFDQVERELQELQSRFSSETTALEAASEKYTTSLQQHLDHKTEIARLLVHIKDNILYYMQAIWEHEPPDQRYFRLYNVAAGWLPVPDDVEVTIDGNGEMEIDFNDGNVAGFVLNEFAMQTLVQIADLDNLIGFKGNYLIFPLKQNNFITWFMMQPYLDGLLLKDPDEFANYTTEELIENFRCLYKENPNAFSDGDIQEWRERMLNRLTAPRREKDIVIVPTDSLYIEALPGEHPLLEDFKLRHRALDVKKAEADVRHAELENVRLAARLFSGEREDPEIDRKIVIEGGDHVILPPDV